MENIKHNDLSILQFTVRASDKGLVPRTNDAQVTIRIRREGLPFFSDSEYVVTVPEDLALGANVFDLDATDPRVGVSSY